MELTLLLLLQNTDESLNAQLLAVFDDIEFECKIVKYGHICVGISHELLLFGFVTPNFHSVGFFMQVWFLANIVAIKLRRKMIHIFLKLIVKSKICLRTILYK